ncbi:prion-inhibition and propagation-domain-containing protein [Tuber brumale]|nr:prion-inhibition and propagation-domain-containing protein [Tuber brumale]
MESIGVALGIAGLAGLFTTCLQLFDLVSTAESHGSACQTLLCKLEVEQVLLLKWGEAVGIFNPQSSDCEERNETYNKRLGDTPIRRAVFNILSCLKTTLEDTNNLVAKYGLQPLQSEDEAFDSSPPQSAFRVTHEKLQQLLKLIKQQASFPRKTRWVVRDKAKFELLIVEIRGFNESLGRLLPEVAMIQQENTRAEVGESSDVAALKTLEEALKGTHGGLSDAASRRLCSLSDAGSPDDIEDHLRQAPPPNACDVTGSTIGLNRVEPRTTDVPEIEKSNLLDTIAEENPDTSEGPTPSVARRCRCRLETSLENGLHVCILKSLQSSPEDYSGTVLSRIRSCEDFTATANFIRSNPPSTPSSSSPTTASFPKVISSTIPPSQPSTALLPALKKSRFHPYQNPSRRNLPTEPRRISFDTGRMAPPAGTSNTSSSTPIYQRRYQRPPSRLGSRSPPGFSNAAGGATDYNTGFAVAKSPMTALQDQSMGLAGVKSPMQALIDQERVLAGVKSPMQAITNMGNLARSADGVHGGPIGYGVAVGAGPADDGAGPAGN